MHVLLALWLQSMSYLRHRALQTEEKYCVQGVVVLQIDISRSTPSLLALIVTGDDVMRDDSAD